MLLVFFVGFGGSMAAATAYRHRTAPRESVAESVPAIAFWRELPGLVRDGWAYTAEKGRSLRAGGYESL